MEKVGQQLQKLVKRAEKYKYTVLILVLGIVLLCVPFGDRQKQTVPMPLPQSEETDDLEARLQVILTQIEGAGEVEVLLSYETGTTHIYQEDTKESLSGDTAQTESKTVLISQSGTEEPVKMKKVYPTYRGALVVCQGADKASVRLAVTRAVAGLTGLGSDHICVIKMKDH